MERLPEKVFRQYLLSPARQMAGGQAEDQDLYLWNKQISAALWEILGDVETLLRFSIDRELTKLNITESNQGSWVDHVDSLIGADGFRYVARAKTFLKFREIEIDHESVIAEWNFSFWCSLLTKRYKDNLWREALRFAFPNSPSRQPEYIFARVRELHILRNRIAHHEPIHNRDIARDYQICMDVLSAISPLIAEWSAKNSRVMQVLAHRPM